MSQKVFYIPNGPKNIVGLFPTVNFANVAQYYLEIKDNALVTIATTTINELQSKCCNDSKLRILFLSYCGTWDGIDFVMQLKEHEAKSSQYELAVTNPLIKSVHGVNRFDVRANDLITLSCIDYRERDMLWIDELIDSPLILSQWSGIQGQTDDYLPLVIQDTKKISFKQDDRWIYEIIIQVKPSHERFIIRN